MRCLPSWRLDACRIERNERIRCHRVADRWRRDLERYRKEHLKRKKYYGNMECSNQREGE